MRKHVKLRLERLLDEMDRLAYPLPEEERKARVARAEIDDMYFFQTYLPHIFSLPPAEFHSDLCALYDLRGGPSICAVHAPRGFGKTPILSQGKPLKSLCYGLHREMLAVSATAELADELTAPIAQELKFNPRILQDFGPLFKEGGSTKFETTLGGSFWAVGRRQPIRGYHPDIAILDDIEDDKQAYNTDRVQEILDWLDKVVIPAMKPQSLGGSNLIMAGTIICTGSVLDRLLHRESIPPERRRIYKALIESGDGQLDSLWEAIRSAPELLQLKRDVGAVAFDSEFQGEPHDAERRFPPEWFDGLGFQEEEFQRVADRGPTIDISFYDPAARDTLKHDYKAIVLLSLATNGLAYVRDAWVRRLSVDAVIDKVYAHHGEFPSFEQWFEANGFQVLYKEIFKLKARDYGFELHLREYTTTQNKIMMIEGLSGFIETGRIRFKQTPDGRWYGDIGMVIDQLIHFPQAKRDDGADALSKAHAIALHRSRTAAYGASRKPERTSRHRSGIRRIFDVIRPR